MMVVNFAYDKAHKEYEIDDPEWGGMTLTIPQTRRFIDLIRRTHPELLDSPTKKPWKERRVGKAPSVAHTLVPEILSKSDKGMSLDQIMPHFDGTVARRTVQMILQGLVKDGKVVRERTTRDMRMSLFRMKREGEGNERGDPR